jgi:iron complex outermembrane receptor protein
MAGKAFILPWVALAMLLAPSVSFCDESGNESADSKTYEIAPVTVTANKIEENVQEIPQSISVIDGSLILDKGITDVDDIIKEIPNLTSSFLYSEDVNFRGINSSIFTNNNPVVIYIDGIPQSNRMAYDASLVNIDRVEVLRGPQGTLYGKDAIGGVINIVTKTPTNEWQGNLGAEYGNYNSFLGTFYVNGPIVNDKLFIGVNAKFAQDDGWVENHSPGMDEDANSMNERMLGANLFYNPTDRLKVKLTFHSDYQKDNGLSGLLAPTLDSIDHTSREDAEDANFEMDTYTKTQSDAQALSLSYAFDAVMLDSITTNKRLEFDGDYDADWGDNPVYDNLYQFQHFTIKTRTEELRLSSRNTEGLRWVGGIYYENEVHSDDRYGMQYPAEIIGMPFDADMDDVSETDSDTVAGFAQATYPFLNKFELTLGARYQWINKEFDSDFYYLPLGTTGPPMHSLHGEESWTAFLPKAGLTYQINDQVSTYASVATGYLPGGFNFWAMSGTLEDNKFDPERSTSYEIGVKSTFSKLYLAANLFYMDIDDIHVYSFDNATGMIRTSNAGKAHSQGAELEFSYLLAERWELTGAAGVIQAEYDEYGSTGYDGNDIEKTPSYTARAGVQYNEPRGFYGRFDVRSQGKTYYNAANYLEEDAFFVADLRLGYRHSNYEIYGYMKNITDEDYIVNMAEQSNGYLLTFGDPRTFGAGFRYFF